MNKTVTCMNCGQIYDFRGAHNDDLGWHVYHDECESSHDIDIDEYMVPMGTRVRNSDGVFGTIIDSMVDRAEDYDSILYKFESDVIGSIGYRYLQLVRKDQFEWVSNDARDTKPEGRRSTMELHLTPEEANVVIWALKEYFDTESSNRLSAYYDDEELQSSQESTTIAAQIVNRLIKVAKLEGVW